MRLESCYTRQLLQRDLFVSGAACDTRWLTAANHMRGISSDYLNRGLFLNPDGHSRILYILTELKQICFSKLCNTYLYWFSNAFNPENVQNTAHDKTTYIAYEYVHWCLWRFVRHVKPMHKPVFCA